MAMAIWILVLGVDLAGGMANDLVGRKYIFPEGAIVFLPLFFARSVFFRCHAHRKRPVSVFLGIAVLVTVWVYVVFFILAENETAAFDRNISLLAKQQIKQISDWKDRQSAWAVVPQAGLSADSGIKLTGHLYGTDDRRRRQDIVRNDDHDGAHEYYITEPVDKAAFGKQLAVKGCAGMV